jgi:RNA polymerase sigma-54 factor
MRLDTSQQLRQQQKLILAPRMIQSMEILQLPIMALEERIQQELQENPVLELQEKQPDELAPEQEAEERLDPDAPSDLERELVVKDDDNNELDFDRLQALSKDWEDTFNEEHVPSRGRVEEEGDKRHDVMQNVPDRPESLHDHLSEQIGFLDISARQAALCRFLVTHIDERGYLSASLEEIIKGSEGAGRSREAEEAVRAIELLEPAGAVSLAEAEEALRIVQQLEPAGIAARDLRECLLLQISDETPHREVLRTLIANHWEDIEHNRLPLIQRRTGFDLPTIKDALEELKHFNPRPGAAYSSQNVQYAVPDIAVERNEAGEYEVRLLDDYIPNIYISRRFLEMLKDKSADPQTREYVKRKIQSAQWLMDSIAQRRSTLEKVTRAIIAHQKNFLEKGPEHVEPLKMQQIADKVGVHVTTVSRAVDDKWVQTPRGVFPLRRFFGGGTTTADGEEVAWETIKQKLLEIIGHEDKASPYSDEELVSRLQETGYPLARRTVTKYRKMLRVPSSRQRKDWTLAQKAGAAASNGVSAPTPPAAPVPAPDYPPAIPLEPSPATESSPAAP